MKMLLLGGAVFEPIGLFYIDDQKRGGGGGGEKSRVGDSLVSRDGALFSGVSCRPRRENNRRWVGTPVPQAICVLDDGMLVERLCASVRTPDPDPGIQSLGSTTPYCWAPLTGRRGPA
ncbi:unnamed protein product [Arctogadus glacialis]